MLTAIDLTRFCNKNDIRIPLQQPWSDDQYSYATDGHILVRIQRIPEITNTDGVSLEHLPLDHDEMAEWHSLPSEIPNDQRVPCKVCKGSGRITECNDCDGTGHVDYTFEASNGETYEENHDCPVCDGSGKTNGEGDRCEECEGKGSQLVPASVKIESIGMNISSHLLLKVHDLPGVQIAIKSHGPYDLPPVRFRFEGGIGLMMPMSNQDA